jgi:hypothetical protein
MPAKGPTMSVTFLKPKKQRQNKDEKEGKNEGQ